MKEAQHMIGDKIEFAQDQNDALIDADALLIVTEWPEFRSPNFNVVGKLLKEKVIFDGRNIYDIKEMQDAGFSYYGIGVKPYYHSTIEIA
jgi:UDPglucose 6-dehydrogenase